MVATLIDLLPKFIHAIHSPPLPYKQLIKERLVFVCLVLMPNANPKRWREDFAPTFVKDWLFKSILNNDPLLPRLGRKC
jgi:hypothetical protein